MLLLKSYSQIFRDLTFGRDLRLISHFWVKYNVSQIKNIISVQCYTFFLCLCGVECSNSMSQEIASVTEWHLLWPVVTHTENCSPPLTLNQFFFKNLSITLRIAKIHSKMCIKKLITHWSITWNLKILISFKNTIPMIIQYFSFPHWFPRNSGIPGIWIFSKELPKFLEFIQTGFWISCTIYSSLGLRWWCSSLFSI